MALSSIQQHLQEELASIRALGLYKEERIIVCSSQK